MLALTGCSDDFVDIDERGAATATTVQDLRLTLDGINGTLKDGFYTVNIYNVDQMFSDEFKEMSEASFSGLSQESSRRAFRFDDFVYTASETDKQWEAYFEIISIANYVLNRVDDLPDPLGQHDQVKGEAMAYRAFAYYYLVNIYADNYTEAKASSSLGLPIITQFGDPSVSMKRETVAKVYDLIIEDLTEGTKLMKPTLSSVFAPSRPMALGMLAKTYLQMGKYEEAKKAAADALSIKNTLLDYKTLPTVPLAINFDLANPKLWSPYPSQDKNSETLFYFMNQNSFDIAALQGATFYSLNPDYLAYTNVTNFVTDDLMALGNPSDIRFSRMIFNDGTYNRFIAGNATGGERGLLKGVSTAELVLIQAECEARTGDFNLAMTQLNNFRANRFLAPDVHVLNAITREQAIQHVLDERQREFMYKGTRMFDIKRLNAHHNANISITHIDPTDNKEYTLEANSPKWNLAIPPNEIAIAPELEQNPRD
jgi:tetratricopeptide (TPR) repeat protein